MTAINKNRGANEIVCAPGRNQNEKYFYFAILPMRFVFAIGGSSTALMT